MQLTFKETEKKKEETKSEVVKEEKKSEVMMEETENKKSVEFVFEQNPELSSI